MLFAYPYCFILFLKFKIDSGVRGTDVHLRCDLRKSAKEFALKIVVCESKVFIRP